MGARLLAGYEPPIDRRGGDRANSSHAIAVDRRKLARGVERRAVLPGCETGPAWPRYTGGDAHSEWPKGHRASLAAPDILPPSNRPHELDTVSRRSQSTNATT